MGPESRERPTQGAEGSMNADDDELDGLSIAVQRINPQERRVMGAG